MDKNIQELFMVMLLIFLVVSCFLLAEQRDSLKEEAVKRGFAELIVIKENQTEFKWKDTVNKYENNY